MLGGSGSTDSQIAQCVSRAGTGLTFRSLMWRGSSVAVVVPTYRERTTIRRVIEGFERLGIVDDIVVVNNNAEPGTSEEVSMTSAREVLEPEQGYGAAIRRGIADTNSDLVCICEADGTFDPADLLKLLAYSDDFEFIYGSRTLREMIWSGANMGHFLRWGNWAVAKLLEAAFGSSHLSDVGCTMRVVSGPAVRFMQPFFTDSGSALGSEMIVLTILGGWRFVQLPLSYHPRDGRRGTTESPLAAAKIGLQMLALIVRYWLDRRSISARMEWAGAERTRLHPAHFADGRQPGGDPIHMFPRPWRRRTSPSNEDDMQRVEAE